MTDERFVVIDEGLDFMVKDTITGDTLIDADGVADVLNDYEKEKEQLKEQIADLETSFDICKHYKETYGDEIVHIKHTIKTMMENERTELGRSVLKQLWEAIQ